MCGLQTGTCLSCQIERYWEEVEREREKAFCLVDWMTFCGRTLVVVECSLSLANGLG